MGGSFGGQPGVGRGGVDVIAWLALAIALTDLVLVMVLLFRRVTVVNQVQPTFIGPWEVRCRMESCLVVGVDMLETIKKWDAVPAVLVPLGQAREREWLRERIGKAVDVAVIGEGEAMGYMHGGVG